MDIQKQLEVAAKTNHLVLVVFLSLIHIFRAHETRRHLVCRLLLEKKKQQTAFAVNSLSRRCLLQAR